MRTLAWRVAVIGAPFLLACGALAPARPTAQPAPQNPAETSTLAETEAPTASATSASGPLEAIWIAQPGPNSRAVSPLRVEGESEPTFENQLGVRLITMQGEVLAKTSAIMEAPIGERGPFALDIEFDVASEVPALLQLFANSPRDGGMTHLSSVPLLLAPAGERRIEPPPARDERIQIEAPQPGATLSGGSLALRGFGWASFENNLVVELLDGGGTQWAQSALTVAAPDLGEPGEFELDLVYGEAPAGPGRVIVWDPSPAFGGPVHLASAEVMIEP